MKRVMVIILLAVLLTSGLLAGCEEVTVTGSGNLTTETFNFSDFNKVEAHRGFQVELTKSSSFSVEITADDNLLEYIEVDKSGDTLRIIPKGNRIYRSVTFRAKITMPDLYGVDLSGGSRASITGFGSSHDLSVELSGGSGIAGDITAGDADFDLSGGSQVNLEGTANDLVVNGSGGSHLSLESFTVDNADIRLSGGGSATVNVNGTLDVNLSGGSRVTYVGDPTLGDIDLSGDSTIAASVEKVFDKQLANQLQTVPDDAVEKSENMINGALMYVSGPDHGTWTGASGLRNIETNTAARPNDKFRAGSIMKPFISVVILQLVEEGRLSLDDPMTRVLPVSVTDRFANSNKITVRMLLNHTAGMPDWLTPEAYAEIAANPTKVWEIDEYLDLAAAQEPYFEPGEGLVYSNTDYNLLGLVIEQATGSTWREEVRERIIEELNLENTLLPEPGEIFIPDDHIRGYLPMGGQLIDATGIDPSMAGAAGGHALVTTAADLTLFLDAVLAGELFKNTQTLEEMLTFKEADPYGMPSIPGIEWEYYGYGLGLEKWVLPGGVELIGHPGTTAGFSATVYYLPAQDITIALAWDIQELREFFIRMILPTIEILAPEFEMSEPPSQSSASTPPITDADGNVIPGSIAAIETVTLGGVEQTITIRGADTTKPVLLFLHGGPGMPSSPWATWNNVHADLEANFVFVHWDQRGAGKSYSEDLTVDDMHLDNFVSDTLELTDNLRERFDQDKIFLWGHSWGSGLGFETLRVNSEPYHAFIASAVRPDWNSTQEMGYEKVLEIAHQANDTEAIQSLESIQPFDPTNPDHVGIRGQFLSQYLVGDFHTEGLEEAWLNYVISDMSPEYPSAYVEQTLAGMDFSRQTIGLEVMTSGYDHATDFPVSTIPVYFIQGRYDYECPGELAEEYYNSLEAPVKSFTWFENSAHDVFYDDPDKFNQEMIRIANEILNPD